MGSQETYGESINPQHLWPRPCPAVLVGRALAHLVERLEAEEEADWWRRAASAAASMSTSLRERGTFSAFRERFSSSRPFRLSERPRRTSERELGEGQESFAPSVLASLTHCLSQGHLNVADCPPPHKAQTLGSTRHQNLPDTDAFHGKRPLLLYKASLSPACHLPYDGDQEGKSATDTIDLCCVLMPKAPSGTTGSYPARPLAHLSCPHLGSGSAPTVDPASQGLRG